MLRSAKTRVPFDKRHHVAAEMDTASRVDVPQLDGAPAKPSREFLSSPFRTALSRILGVVLLVTLLASQSAWAPRHPGVATGFLLSGWILLGMGVVGRIWCALYIIGKKTFSLVTEGPYSMCRNPLYFFSFLGGVGAMLLTERLLMVATFTLLFWAYFPHVMRREESSLRSLHGQRFEQYRLAVPVFWPDVRRLREPDKLEVSPKLFRRFLLEMIWFIWIGGAIALLQQLQAAGYVSVVLDLY